MKRYVVVMYDDDQQQAFWDVHDAESEDEATMMSCELRDYAVHVDTLSLDELQGVYDRVEKPSPEQVVEDWQMIVDCHEK